MYRLLTAAVLRRAGSDERRQRTLMNTAASVAGIAVNLLLFALKLAASLLSGSLAAAADAINNLSDAASSVMALFSVRLAEKHATEKNPFGFGRAEYLGALGVGLLIVLMALELFLSALRSLFSPESAVFSLSGFLLLFSGIPFKLWLSLFYRRVHRHTNSPVLKAAEADSRSDCLVTGGVLLSMLVGHLTGFNPDGWISLLVAAFVFMSGFTVIRDTVTRLLGGTPDRELAEKLLKKVRSYPYILDVHDYVLHDYGPGRCMASIHAEVPADGDLLRMHDVIDRMEHEIEAEFHVPICVHMDPVTVTPGPARDTEAALHAFLLSLDPPLHLHDFHYALRDGIPSISFDVDVPPSFLDMDTVAPVIRKKADELLPGCLCDIHFDKEYYHV